MTAYLKFLAIVLLLASSACLSAGVKAIKDASVVSRIEVGKSTRSDVVALLGYPLAATHKGQGAGEATWHYYYATAAPTPTAFIPAIKAVTPNLRETTRVLSVTFDRDGTVKSLDQEQIPLPPQQVHLGGRKG
ncbi:MAG: outer membrane protein assembly factor BamE domain-containing protein [Thermodesulfobacteriota bacterium]